MTMTQIPTPSTTDDEPVKRLRQRSWLGAVGTKLLGVWGARLGIAWIGLVAFFAVFGPLLANSHPYLIKTTEQADGGARWSSPMLASLTPMDVTLLLLTLVSVVVFPLRRLGLGAKSAVFTWLACIIVPVTFWGEVAEVWSQGTLANPDSILDAIQSQKQVLIPAFLVAVVCLAGLVLLPLARVSWPVRIGVGLGGLLIVLVFTQVYVVNPTKNPVFSRFRTMQAEGLIEQAFYPPIPYSPGDDLNDLPIDLRVATPGLHPTEQEIARDMKTAALQTLGVVDQSNSVDRTIADARKAIDRYVAEYQSRDSANARTERKAIEQAEALAAVPQRTRLFLMGTTDKGQDLSSRMIHACRIALAIGLIATSIAVAIGITIGGLMGYFSGWIDLIGMRLVEVFSAIPVIFLLIAIVAFWGRTLYLMMIVLGLTGWVGYALFVRAEFLKLRNMDYVMAARASGTGLFTILFKHMLPNGVTPVLVSASFGIAGMILTEATLSFIGLGLVNEPSWGQMLSNAAGVGGRFYWWLAVYPILAIFFTVFAYNLVGEALRDAIDPRAAK